MAAESSQDPLIGALFGGARIQQRVSKGLLADVYMGHYERLGVPVAVKVLSPKAMAQGVNAERFVREGRALAQLAHPNIIKIYNVGQEHGRYFIIMDWIQDGMNLRQLAQTRPLTPAQSLKVIQRLCDALEYIHGKNLVHRDIKPANVCLRRGGHPVLMDFSLMKDQSSDVQLTAPGTIMGTVNFMPPEQAQPGGPFGDLSPRSDVYSLGGTLFWLLTGKPPFKGRTPMETIIKLMREPAPAPSSLNPTVPPAVDELIAATLSKKQEQRPQSARELAERIEAIFQAHRAALDAAQRPEPSTEDGGPSSGRQARGDSASGSTQGEARPTGRLGAPAASASAQAQPPAAWGGAAAPAPAPAPTRPLAPVGALAHQAPAAMATAQRGFAPAPGAPAPAPHQPMFDPLSAPLPPPPGFGQPEPGPGAGEVGHEPHQVDENPYAPAASTEGAAAGMLQVPPELRAERKPKPTKKRGPPWLLIAGLLLVIAVSVAVFVYVVWFMR